MSTVASSNENQTLADELAEARALIEAGEYESALDALAGIWEAAQAQDDANGLNEVRLLAERVSNRALRGSDRERADALRHRVPAGVDAAAASASRLRQAFRRWTLIVVTVWLVASVFVAAMVEATSKPDAFISPGFLAVLLVICLTGIALSVWLVGVLIVLLDHHVPVGTLVRRGWLGRWSVLVVAVWLVLSVVSARQDFAASRAGWTFINLGLYGSLALVVWLLGVLVHRLVVRRRRRRSRRSRTEHR